MHIMLKDQVKEELKKELESWAERLGERVGGAVSTKACDRSSRLGKRAGTAMARQVERFAEVLDKEEVTVEEQLGIGGKIGTGLGVIAKHAVERRYGILGKVMGSKGLIAEGRTTGAKAEKIVKRVVKNRLRRVAEGRKEGPPDCRGESRRTRRTPE
jgi:hypothetical protein